MQPPTSSNGAPSPRDTIKVVARFRPPNSLEQREGGRIIVEIDEETGTNVKLTSSSDPPGGFNFDRAFGIQTNQQEIFEYGVRGIVDEVMAGYNGTVFAYGQTGSGKSFTMMVSHRSYPYSFPLLSVILAGCLVKHYCFPSGRPVGESSTRLRLRPRDPLEGIIS